MGHYYFKLLIRQPVSRPRRGLCGEGAKTRFSGDHLVPFRFAFLYFENACAGMGTKKPPTILGVLSEAMDSPRLADLLKRYYSL
jgi:hypothetical protein